MQNQDVIRIDSAQALEVLNRSEIDVQISTAKQYPRVIEQSLKRIEAIAMVNQKTAAECFYALPRDGKTIEGPSVRFAEIVATCWGNLRVQARVIGNDGRQITVQGVCHDLETNVAFSSEVRRGITKRDGRTFSEDMQIVTGNAASAIAIRNAIFKCVPVAVLSEVVEAIKKKAIGQSGDDIATRREKMLAHFAKSGVTEEMVLFYLGVDSIDEIDAEGLFKMTSIRNAAKEGTTDYKQALIDPFEKSKQKAKAVEQTASAKDRVAAAMKANAKQEAEVIDDMPIFNE